jgi:hypothetical protein
MVSQKITSIVKRLKILEVKNIKSNCLIASSICVRDKAASLSIFFAALRS